MKKEQKIKLSKHNLLIMLIILLCSVLLFSLVAIVFIWDSDVTSFFEREIVFDDYTSKTVDIYEDDVLFQTVYIKGKVYGFRLRVNLKDDVGTDGHISLTVLDSMNQPIAKSTLQTLGIKNGYFNNFILDNPISVRNQEKYILKIETEDTDSSIVFSVGNAIAQEDEKYDLTTFVLFKNDKQQKDMLALQYITKYGGNFIYIPYIFFSSLLTVFFIVLYLYIFIYKAAIHHIFLLASLVLGFIFLFVIPFRTAPDEYVHIANVYSYSNRVFGIKDKNGSLTLRSGDEMLLSTYDFSATNIFSYREVYEELFVMGGGDEQGTTIKARNSTKIYPMAYLPSIVGVTLARLLNLSKSALLFMGRFSNLLFYSFGVMYAIKIIPKRKQMFTLVGLLPISLSLAASFSYDVFVITLSFILLATVLKLSLQKDMIKVKDMLPLTVTAVLLAPAKAIYLPLLLLILLIPFSKYESKKKAMIILSVTIFIALLFWAVFNTSALNLSLGAKSDPVISESNTIEALGEPVFPVKENNEAEQTFTFGYILRHIPQTVVLIIRSFVNESPTWLQGLIGGRLGEIIAVNIEINIILVIAVIFLVFLSVIDNEKEHEQLPRRSIGLLLLTGTLVVLLSFFVCLTWTPINYTSIFGLQGRYFIPVVPIFLTVVKIKNLKLKKSLFSPVIYIFSIVTMLFALQAFLIIVSMYPPSWGY